MAKARIVYVVDDKELKKVSQELKGIQGENKKVEESFKGTNQEIKKSKTSVVDLKGAIAGLGLAALAGAAIKGFIQLNAEIAKSRKEVALLTKATGAALDSITAKLRATAKVFDKDFNETLRSANAASQQFGITMTEALNEINEGFSRGLDINGQYLDSIAEYSPFMKEAGISFRQFNLLIQKQVTEGIFSDKGVDAIKEGTINIREMTPAVQDALKAIKLSGKEITADIKSGATTYFEVMQEIAIKTREALDPAIKGQILADIYRGAGEDAGNYALTLDQVGDSFEDLTEDQQTYVDAQVALLEATEKTEKALLTLTSSTQGLGIAIATFWENIKSGTIEGLNLLIESFQKSEAEMENYRKKIAGSDKESLESGLKDLNEKLVIAEKELKRVEEQTDKNSLITKIWTENVDKLNIKITEAEDKLTELIQAEKDDAEAKILDEIATKKLAASNKLQAEATEKARKESILAAKAMEKEALARQKSNKAFTEQSVEGIDAAKKLQDENDKTTEKFIEGIDKQIRKKAEQFEEDERTREASAERDQKWADEKAEKAQFAIDIGIELARSFVDLQIAELNREMQANEAARNAQLELAIGNKDAEDRINREFDVKQDQLRAQQKEKEKTQAVISILISSSQAALKGIALFGPPPSPLGIAALAAVGVITALQLGAVAKLKEGAFDLRGPGTSTSDSIPAMLSVGETVLSAKTTDDYYPAIKAIFNREISPDIMNNIAMHQDTQPRTVVYDYDKLAKAVMNQPQKTLVADENGFTGYVIRQGKSLEIKQAKYRM